MGADTIEQVNPLWGDVSRSAYISDMRALADSSDRGDLSVSPQLVRSGWRHTDIETNRGFDSFAGGRRAEVSAVTLNRIHDLIDASDEDSASDAKEALRQSASTGDNYQFGSALYKAEGELKLQILDALVEQELMIGFPSSTIDWIERAGGQAIQPEALGYDLAFFEKVWEFAQHPDIGLREKESITEKLLQKDGNVISAETWQTEEGIAARNRWSQRHEALGDEIDAVLIQQATDLCADPEAAPEDHTIHALANDLEDQMVKRWRSHYATVGEDASLTRIHGLAKANLDLRLADAQVKIKKAEQTIEQGNPGNINIAGIGLWRLQELLGLDTRYESVASVLTPLALGNETLLEYQGYAISLEQRVDALRPRRQPASIAAKARSLKGLFPKLLRK